MQLCQRRKTCKARSAVKEGGTWDCRTTKLCSDHRLDHPLKAAPVFGRCGNGRPEQAMGLHHTASVLLGARSERNKTLHLMELRDQSQS